MSAERAWAAAMAMKSAQSTENTQKKMARSTKRQIISRLSKAIQYAKHLVSCLRERETSRVTDIDKMEASAYLASLRGALHFEKARWNACIQDYSIARMIYATLGSGTRVDLFKDLLSSTVDPSIRYAAYQLRFSRTKAVSDIAIEAFPPGEGDILKQIESMNPDAFVSSEKAKMHGKPATNDIPSNITWRQRTVKLEDASIAQAISIANAKEHELSQVHAKAELDIRQLAAAYDDVITARQEAVDATKSAVDELTAEGLDMSDNRVQSLQLTRTAVNYAVIELRIGRNRVLCGPHDGADPDRAQTKRSGRPSKNGTTRVVKNESTGIKLAKLRERVALYDSILQNIDAVRDLSGVIGDGGFTEELSAKRAYFRALK
jgi:signal recognition particle subunit SRP68